MKLELPLAAFLVAAGCLLWFSQSQIAPTVSTPPPKRTGTSSPRTGTSTPASGQRTGKSADNAATPKRTGIVEHAGREQASEMEFGRVATVSYHAPTDDMAQAAAANARTESASTRIVQRAAVNLRSSPPLEARTRIQTQLFGQTFVAEGRYLQLGQGSGKARLEFALRDDASGTMQFVQTCDGQLLYSQQSFRGETTLEVVNLNHLRTQVPAIPGFASPGNLLAMGELASLMENLSRLFDFDAPEETELAGIPMYSLRGRWKPGVLEKMTIGLVGVDPNNPLETLPPHIPLAVHLMLGNDNVHPFFPYRISFYRTTGASTSAGVEPMIQMELFELGRTDSIADHLFYLSPDDSPHIDATQRYVKRVLEYQENNRQHALNPTISTTR